MLELPERKASPPEAVIVPELERGILVEKLKKEALSIRIASVTPLIKPVLLIPPARLPAVRRIPIPDAPEPEIVPVLLINWVIFVKLIALSVPDMVPLLLMKPPRVPTALRIPSVVPLITPELRKEPDVKAPVVCAAAPVVTTIACDPVTVRPGLAGSSQVPEIVSPPAKLQSAAWAEIEIIAATELSKSAPTTRDCPGLPLVWERAFSATATKQP